MPAQVVHDLEVGPVARDVRAPADVAQERHVDERRGDAVPGQRRGGDGERPALAAAADDDPGGVDLDTETGQRVGDVDGAGAVDEGAAVVVRRRVLDALGHEPADPLPARDVRVRVGGVVALAAGVDDEVRETGCRPGRPVDGQTAAPGVADELHDDGQRAGQVRRAQQPRGDAVAVPAGEPHVVDVEGGQRGAAYGVSSTARS